MITQQQTERLAAAVNALRPEWAVASLATFIAQHLAGRAYLDAAVALTYIATERKPDGSWASLTPGRVRGSGPWWHIGTTDPEGETARERADREYRQRLAGFEERRRAVAACHLCDDRGYLPTGRVCGHTDETSRAHHGAALARANIRPTVTPESRITEEP